jgi:hypothetical protein
MWFIMCSTLPGLAGSDDKHRGVLTLSTREIDDRISKNSSDTGSQSKRGRRAPSKRTVINVNVSTGVKRLLVPYKDEVLTPEVDGDMVQAVARFTWTAQIQERKNKGKVAYISTLIRMSDGSSHRIGLQRLVHMLNHGQLPPGLVVDHRDRDPLNNRISNLRALPPQLNSINADHVTQGSSIYPGVSWHKISNKWRAITTVKKGDEKKGKQLVLGFSNDQKHAAKLVLDKLMEIYPGADWNALAPEFFPGIPFQISPTL